jgi:uncharacterized membrane protein YagU involved in acid resistance
MPSRREQLAAAGLIGAIAGLVATAAMTASMDFMYRRLPKRERYPLPPRELTEQILDGSPTPTPTADAALTLATLASHFGYGAATGALYGALAARPPPSPALAGAAYGALVWAASYLGWIPMAGLLRPANRHPARRNALMITAHLVWGTTLGVTTNQLTESSRPFRGGPVRDR